jgi:two-component system, cell cycle sensor histidine kinase and response regulator CckA
MQEVALARRANARYDGDNPLPIQALPRRIAMVPRILVVDDEPMVRALIARVLTDAGYEVVAVANGKAALDAARGAEVGFDLVVTNNYMPGLNGAELIARVRHDFPSLPILHIDDISRKRLDEGLPDDVPTVYKPFSVATLRLAVQRLLSG